MQVQQLPLSEKWPHQSRTFLWQSLIPLQAVLWIILPTPGGVLPVSQIRTRQWAENGLNYLKRLFQAAPKWESFLIPKHFRWFQ